MVMAPVASSYAVVDKEVNPFTPQDSAYSIISGQVVNLITGAMVSQISVAGNAPVFNGGDKLNQFMR